jgi:hypothetical protein
MINYLYNQYGNAVGFITGMFIYDMSGNAVGQINNGTHVHKLSGSYVGEIYKDMVVDMHMGNLGNVGNPGNPGNMGNPGNPGNRGGANYGYEDVFDKLLTA